MCNSLQPHGLYPVRMLCPPLSPGACSDSCPSTWCCCITISSSVAPFFFCLQSFPASGYFPMRGLFASGDQSIRASASVLSMNIQGWFPLGLTGLASLQSRRHLGVFSRNSSKASGFQCSAFFIVKLSYPLHRWCHPAISSSDAVFSFCPPSFPASGTFPMSQLFASGTKILEC